MIPYILRAPGIRYVKERNTLVWWLPKFISLIFGGDDARDTLASPISLGVVFSVFGTDDKSVQKFPDVMFMPVLRYTEKQGGWFDFDIAKPLPDMMKMQTPGMAYRPQRFNA